MGIDLNRIDELAQLSRFSLVGLAAMITHGIGLALWADVIGLGAVLANSLAFLMAFGVSYLGHYHWTFRSKAEHRHSVGRFFGVAVAGFLLNLLIMYSVTIIYQLNHWWGFLLIVITIPILTYLLSRNWVFGD